MTEHRIACHEEIDLEIREGLRVFFEPLGDGGLGAIADLGARRARYAALVDDVIARAVPNPAVRSEDRSIPREDPGEGEIRVRIYEPTERSDPLPALVLMHGGGLIMGTLGVSELSSRAIVDAVGCVIVSVDYRLAPEHPHPAPVEDCYAALAWAAANAGALGIDRGRIALGGSSAGGGLAAGTALLARDRGGPPVVFQLLVYPMLDDRDATPSSLEFDAILTWSRRHNRSGWSALLGDRAGTAGVDHYAAPARARDLSGLPPALIQVGELEVFRDEDVDYAARLLAAGVATQLHVYPGAFHAWDSVAPGAPAAVRALQERIEALGRALHPPGSAYTAVTSPPLGLNVAPT
jgi:acetyl esterase/lipase